MAQSRSFAIVDPLNWKSYLSSLKRPFFQNHLICSASTWKPHYLSVKTLTRVVIARDLSGAI